MRQVMRIGKVISFKPSATHLRVFFVLLNVLTAGGIIGMGVWSRVTAANEALVGADGKEVTGVRIASAADFRFKDDEVFAPKSGAATLVASAQWLQPKRPPKVPEATPGEGDPKAAEETQPAEEIAEGGPLAEEWEYVMYLLVPDDPLKNWAKLEKKSSAPAAPAPPPAGPAASSRLGSSRTSIRRPTSAASRLRTQQQQQQTISFSLSERKVKNEELGLEFFVDSIDENEIVYWVPASRAKMYRLPFKEKTFYARSGRETLGPEPVEEGTEAAPEGEGRFIIKDRPEDFEDLREEEYEAIKHGKLPLEAATTLDQGSAAPASGGAAAATATPSASSSPVQRFQGGAGSPRPQPQTPEERAQALREFSDKMKEAKSKMSDKERAEWEKAENELLRGGKGEE
jgi:hypothetical protein